MVGKVEKLLYGKPFVTVKLGTSDLLFTEGEILKAKKRTVNLTKLTTTPEGKRNYQRNLMRKRRKAKRKK